MVPQDLGLIRNHLLTSLSQEVLASLTPKLALFSLNVGQILYRPEEAMDAAYFPESGIISLVSKFDDGKQAEVGLVGRESMLGGALAGGAHTSFTEAIVQASGTAFKLSTQNFYSAMVKNSCLRTLVFLHHEAFHAQVTQTAACNSLHSLEQRLIRWLLMADDRVRPGELMLTQEYLAIMLGVHRPSLTVSARAIQSAGLVKFSRGKITILARDRLEAAACACYGLVKRRSSALLDSRLHDTIGMAVARDDLQSHT